MLFNFLSGVKHGPEPRAPLGWAAAMLLLLGMQSAQTGDILRGGAAPPNAGNRPAGASTGAAQAAAARSNAQDALARTSRAVESVQRAQLNAARAAAGANNAGPDPTRPGFILPDVPNGLGPGGLQVAPGVGTDLSLWTGAFLPTQTSGGGKTQVTIKQTAQQALLNWQTFNVGRDTNLHFDQSEGKENVGQWTAFNKVNDPSGRPSQILGSITAPGQVYVVNQNGIIFGGASQVNVHTLVASSLPINEALVRDGLLNQGRTTQFLFSALPQAGGTPFTPPPLPASGRIGDVTVLSGAQLTAPTTEANVGGRIVLVGPNVNNRGSLATPDGQTILAAGLQVAFAAHSSSDPSLRGLDVFVGNVGAYGGTVTNEGLIEIMRGSANLAGKEIRQMGAINSSTSVSLNGRIDLRAEYNSVANTAFDPLGASSVPFFPGGLGTATSTGTVYLGPDSVTRILPEWASQSRVIGRELALKSEVNLLGKVIYLAHGASIHAPAGNVGLTTGVWDYQLVPNSGATNSFVRSGGQIYLDRNAMINVAGTTDAAAPLSQAILNVTLRASELADSPLQRVTSLRGAEITVDLRKTGTYNGRGWVGTPLADLRGYLNLIERTVGELTTSGGSILLNSGGSVVVQPSAVLDVSGGWVNFAEGTVKTTRLLYRGQLMDIASATPDRIYDSIYTGEFVERHPRWNVDRTYRVPWMSGEHFEAAYLQGANGGRLALSGSSAALDGVLRGGSVTGMRQTVAPASGGTLDLSFEIQKLVPGALPDPVFSPTPPTVVFGSGSRGKPAGGFEVDENGNPRALREDRVAKVMLDPDLLKSQGFSSLSVRNPDGDIKVPRGVDVIAPARGSIRLEGANVLVAGRVEAPGGRLSFAAYTISPSVAAEPASGAVLPQVNPGRGQFNLLPGAVLNAAGLIIDQRYVSSGSFSQPHVIDGGTVSIRSYSGTFAPGSLVDVSGGVLAGPRGTMTYGRAGTLEIIAGVDPNATAVDQGQLTLSGTLRGFSGTNRGGTLSLQAQLIQIGGSMLHPLSLRLEPDFFQSGGFSTFNLTGIGEKDDSGGDDSYLPAVSIAAGTRLTPRVPGYLAIPAGGPNGRLALVPYERPEGLRAPLNLRLVATGLNFSGNIIYRGDVLISPRASVQTDSLGAITLRGQTVAVYGSLAAPSGSIDITGDNLFAERSPGVPKTTVYLAPSARLSTAGSILSQVDRFGRRRGMVLPGGSISVSGNVVAERGAVLDVSGATGLLDLHPVELGLDAAGQPLLPGSRLVPLNSGVNSPLWAALFRPVRVDSSGGSILLRGGQFLFTDAELLGKAGGPTVTGGSLSVSSGRFVDPGSLSNTAQTNLTVSQSGRNLPLSFAGQGISGIGQAVRDQGGALIPAMGYFSADAFSRGGFASLSLGGTVEFKGPVTINAQKQLRLATGGVIRADAPVRLTAAYAYLGQAFLTPPSGAVTSPLFSQSGALTPNFNFAPTTGAGELHVTADQIDLGTLSLQGIGRTTLTARGGDIRGNGTFQAAGSVRLTAAQIYPTTGSAFNLLVYPGGGDPGTLTITGSGTRDLPLSAAGMLNIFAGKIYQGGILRAPFGAIQLGWDGSGSAPFLNPIAGTTAALPIATELILAAGSQTSVSGVNPRTGQGVVIPYGMVEGGDSWVAPSGLDITALGPPERRLALSARNLLTEPGSLVDVRGGGDLLAYRFVAGTGGSQDVLADGSSFAVLPGYDSGFAPRSLSVFPDDPGYTNDSIPPGEQIYIGPNASIPSGNYTLLPARYALLQGAYLVRPVAGSPIGSFALPDGSQLVSGYRFNTLNRGTDSRAQTRFELASGEVVRARSKYEEYFANVFFAEAASNLNLKTPRLPQDSGRLILQATQSLSLSGQVLGKPLGSGRGAVVDISSPLDIIIAGSQAQSVTGTLLLSAGQLNAIGAESLLVGGVRTFLPGGLATVAVNTGRLTLDNFGTPLIGSDIILAANQQLQLSPGAVIRGSGTSSFSADLLQFGTAGLAGSGNGLLVRVADDPAATVSRREVTPNESQVLTVGSSVSLSGGSITIDSTARTDLDSSAQFSADTVNLSSGRISVLLDNPGTPVSATSLELEGSALRSLQQNSINLNLLSYTSTDLYGTGSFRMPGTLRLSSGQLRGFQQAGGTFGLSGNTVILDNVANSTATTGLASATGNLQIDARNIRLGNGILRADQFSNVVLNASNALTVDGRGSFLVQNNLAGSIGAITSARGANYGITAGGSSNISAASGGTALAAGLGGTLTLEGSSVNVGTSFLFPSGSVTLRGTTGDVVLTGKILASGTQQNLADLIRFSDGGEIRLESLLGSIQLVAGSEMAVSAAAGGGNAGLISLKAANGTVAFEGSLAGNAGQGGRSGSISVDLRQLPSTSALTALNEGGFLQSRDLRVRSGDVLVQGTNSANQFRLAADAGNITVSGTVNAAGRTGGMIVLAANGSLTVLPGAVLTAAGQQFSSSGKGGSITLEAGTQRNGIVSPTAQLDLQAGSLLDLSVANFAAGSAITPGSSAFRGQFTGTVHLRAPRNAAGTDLALRPLDATIRQASSLLVEGYRVYDLTNAAPGGSGTITAAQRTAIDNDGIAFLGAAGTTTAGYTALQNRLLTNNAGLSSILVLAPGAEVISRTGSLTLGNANTTATNDWNLAPNRYGPKSAPGVLTLRAPGDLVFLNSLSDGFSGGSSLWLAPLMTQNPLLPINTQSWSYRLTAGADLDSAAAGATLPISVLGTDRGSLLLGKNYGNATFNNVNGLSGLTSAAINNGNRLQTIRTGSGGIDIHAGRDIRFLNTFASIYTAGTQVANATTLFTPGDFGLPVLNVPAVNLLPTQLGAQQQLYPAQYAMSGGSVALQAAMDIARYTLSGTTLIDDASRQLPTSWLYRRGYVDPLTGRFGQTGTVVSGNTLVNDPAASTTWWVDYSNFFQSVGALGGGDIALTAGRDVRNVDASSVTNARAAMGFPDASRLVELGGGNVSVRAGSDILGGTYYVERGLGKLEAGASITLEATRVGDVAVYNPRSPSSGITGLQNSQPFTNPDVTTPEAWLPTTLFVGKGGFDLSARQDVLLGPVANPFLISSGIGNKYWYKTYFSTYAPETYVNVSSLTGSITHRMEATYGEKTAPQPLLQAWIESHFSSNGTDPGTVFNRQPWLRVAEGNATAFTTSAGLMPGTLRSTSFAGDIRIVGRMNLSPSSTGSLELAAAGAFIGLNRSGTSFDATSGITSPQFTSATINLSDAPPSSLPGILRPIAYHSFAPLRTSNSGITLPLAGSTASGDAPFLSGFDTFFSESGSYTGAFAVTQTKQALHAPGPLHSGDPNPVRVYGLAGDISGLTLFSPKLTRMTAGQDITDIALYLQNVGDRDISIISAGRDILPYNPSSALRTAASQSADGGAPSLPAALLGDLQIGGPGALEILAGRKITLGAAPGRIDGTGDGISSIGNLRNPFLPGTGANLIVAAGLGPLTSLSDSAIDFETFYNQSVRGGDGQKYLAELGEGGFDDLTPEGRAQLSLEVFYRILRDAGTNYNDPTSPGFRSYATGTTAINTLFGGLSGEGNILLSSRSLRTRSGGNIGIIAPAGGLELGTSLGSGTAPPGIVTETGGDISIFARDSVDIGVLRIFTLRGGDITIWSSEGDIAAGSSSKTVASAPPTRVVIDPQSADVATDLAGLSTGGGIGVLATVQNIEPGNVSLIAPLGAVDAGDAGIRSAGNLSIAAATVLNAGNIAVAGTSAGAPAAPAAAPAVSTPAPAPPPASASNTGAETTSAANRSSQAQTAAIEVAPSEITVEVLGYGGAQSDPVPTTVDEEDEEEEKRRRRLQEAQAPAEVAPSESAPAPSTGPGAPQREGN